MCLPYARALALYQGSLPWTLLCWQLGEQKSWSLISWQCVQHAYAPLITFLTNFDLVELRQIPTFTEHHRDN